MDNLMAILTIQDIENKHIKATLPETYLQYFLTTEEGSIFKAAN